MAVLKKTMEYLKIGAGYAPDWLKTLCNAVFTKSTARGLILTTLVSFISALLFLFACVGYLAFYHEYLPDQVMTVPVHLQYGYELNPYGVASLSHANFKDYQDYDISVTLNLPNSPSNLARGNFMLALYLLDSPHAESSSKTTAAPTAAGYASPMPTTVPAPQSVLNNKNILFTSTRPAIMPYTDPLVSLAKRLLLLAYHVFVPCSETTRLTVPMAERLLFAPGRMMPGSLVLDVQAGQSLQVYDVQVTVTAQLGGLRWFMHTWWATSFVLFTALFWVSEVFFLAVSAGVVRILFGVVFVSGTGIRGPTPPSRMKREGQGAVPPSNNPPRIKREGEAHGKAAAALEDVPMTFPTSSQQPPLRYDPEPGGHASGVDEGGGGDGGLPPPAQGDVGGEADVEEDEEDYDRYRYREEDEADLRARDSGIGTSFSERDGAGAGGGSVRRRSSLGRMGGGN